MKEKKSLKYHIARFLIKNKRRRLAYKLFPVESKDYECDKAEELIKILSEDILLKVKENRL